MTELGENVLNHEKPQKYSFDAVIVLGAFMHKNEKTGKWELPTIIEEDPGKVVGGHSRAIAVQQMLNEGLTPKFIVTGGVQKDEADGVSRAETLKELITKKYKVPEDNVVAITTVGNTLGNLDDTVKYFKEHPEILKLKRVAVLSNELHLKRAMMMFSDNAYFRENDIEITPIAAEDLLIRRSKHYKKWTEDVNSHPGMEVRKRMEKQGREDYRKGTYNPLSS
ncbi:MAG: hypothetical protein COX79_05745 [Candidatus Levybacteria bacterium CG_4_10_14_0_2_um_filter_36_16]|nr:MAG: hypothetical protein AUK12_01245 [Candidatus Levybacteria bacterium CG2_30_37_29]PIR78757.1 MAG: hypothetical protein COU26_04965 [Candidatus Levybacteria bacterium CG10_big_fil_rev_8_21_14_0_10_36_30]PIZ96172.1 MAG: hypothetical protein COX79_05745 [Candidatus Levybacteria bacterium CG_4_10_14_0_2_um_filter_36_16]